MNWAVVDTAADDYAADTRGYTWDAVFAFTDDWWTFRFAETLLSKRPNGLTLQKNLQNAHSENLNSNSTAIGPRSVERGHLLGFMNYANMGDCHQALAQFLLGCHPEARD